MNRYTKNMNTLSDAVDEISSILEEVKLSFYKDNYEDMYYKLEDIIYNARNALVVLEDIQAIEEEREVQCMKRDFDKECI